METAQLIGFIISLVGGVAIITSTAIGTVVWWGWKRIITGQSEMTSKLQELAIAVAKICGNVEQGLQWQELHTKVDDRREVDNAEDHLRISDLIEKLRAGGL